MSENIAGKVVVITGASSGLGESTARHLAKLGASVVLGARRTDRLDAIVKGIKADGGTALAETVDVTVRSQVEALVQKVIATYGRIDVLVNNAGIMPIAPLAALKVDEWDRMIDLNIKGVLYGIAAALPYMQKQKSGHIINIASVFGIKVFAPGGTVHCATKAAVRTLTEGLRMEVHADKIRTTIIDPGAVDSELKTTLPTKHLPRRSRSFTRPWLYQPTPLLAPSPTPSNSLRTWTSMRSSSAQLPRISKSLDSIAAWIKNALARQMHASWGAHSRRCDLGGTSYE